MIFERIKLQEVNAEDVKWLTIGCRQRSWDKQTPAEIVQNAVDGNCIMYRLHGNATGIVVLTIDNTKSQLWIDLVAGKGLMRHQEEFRNLLRMMAQGMGLKSIAGLVSRTALAKWYDKHTAGKPVATLYVEEI